MLFHGSHVLMISRMQKFRRGALAALTAALTAGMCLPHTATQAQAQDFSSMSSKAGRDFMEMSSAFLQQLPSIASAPGGVKRYVTAGGVNREYTLVLPGNYDPARSYPVIIGFGGWQHNAAQTQSYERLEQAAQGRAIVVYAQGVNNAWGGAPYADTSLQSDIAYVRAIINDLSTSHNINRGRVYAAGLSNGGGMAAALACHAPDLVAAVASVSGAYYNPTVSGCANGSVRTLLMHADNDDVVHYDGGNRHGAPYKSVRTVFYDQGVRNGCTMNAVTPRRQGNATAFTPNHCRTHTEIVKIHGGGHTWFTNPSATNWVVTFFLG